MRIYLLGLPGSGKTTLGKQVAKALNLQFHDLDAAIEKAANQTIPEIFTQHGEDYFRKLEQQQLHQTSTLENTLIATGGGAPCFFDNMDFIKNHGTSIFIDVSVEALFNRLHGHGTSKRPLLQNKTDQELKDDLANRRTARLPFYTQADIILSNDQLKYQDLLQALKL